MGAIVSHADVQALLLFCSSSATRCGRVLLARGRENAVHSCVVFSPPQVDLCSQASVKKAAAEFKKSHKELKLLFLNAGVSTFFFCTRVGG